MAEDAVTENAKRQMAADKEARDKSHAEYAERMKGKPTPTQEENDKAILGVHVIEHEDDGSGPDPNQRSVEAGKPGSYQTRQTSPSRQTPPRSTS